jgi:hypothetical protein
MDAWKEREIAAMLAGGNEKLRAFFTKHGVSLTASIAERYATPAAGALGGARGAARPLRAGCGGRFRRRVAGKLRKGISALSQGGHDRIGERDENSSPQICLTRTFGLPGARQARRQVRRQVP